MSQGTGHKADRGSPEAAALRPTSKFINLGPHSQPWEFDLYDWRIDIGREVAELLEVPGVLDRFRARLLEWEVRRTAERDAKSSPANGYEQDRTLRFFPLRPYTLLDMYAGLAAIYDMVMEGVRPINPWAYGHLSRSPTTQHQLMTRSLAYEALRIQVGSIPRQCKRVIEGWLREVREDLTQGAVQRRERRAMSDRCGPGKPSPMWLKVHLDILEMIDQGEPWSGLKELAQRFNCGITNVSKACNPPAEATKYLSTEGQAFVKLGAAKIASWRSAIGVEKEASELSSLAIDEARLTPMSRDLRVTDDQSAAEAFAPPDGSARGMPPRSDGNCNRCAERVDH